MRRRTRGFTLIEVVISLAILAIAMFGTVSVISYTTRMNMANRERLLAMRAAEKKIEQMLSCAAFDDIYLKFKDPVEGSGWEQVWDGDSLGVPRAALLPLPLSVSATTVPTGYAYTAANGWNSTTATLYVRFPLNAAGTGFTEDQAGTFVDFKQGSPAVPVPLWDLNGAGGAVTTDNNIQITDMKILPVWIEVFWKGASGPGHITYKYTFLRKT